jgi:hypothetical protein
METNNMNIRERFEEIWPVPSGVYWHDKHGCYLTYAEDYDYSDSACNEYQARLDTFTRCQETTEIYVSIIDEMVRHMGIIKDTSTDLRAIGIARESVGIAKQKMERIK